MYYRHQLDYVYPDRCDQHMIEVKHLRDVVLDEDYPYLQKGFWYGCQRVVAWIVLNALAFWLLRITHGLRIHGRENLKKHKKEFKNGAITIANHVFEWDSMCVMKAIRPRLYHFPAWAGNLEGPNGPLLRMVGGIPIPDNIPCLKKFKKAMEEVFQRKGWVHFFPEASMWYYYPDIRPFKKAVFQYAVRYDRPVIPMTFTFRPRTGITKFFTKKPFVDLTVGEAMFPDHSLTPGAATRKLQEDAYHIMQVTAGINPGDPTYNTDQDPANYKSTM